VATHIELTTLDKHIQLTTLDTYIQLTTLDTHIQLTTLDTHIQLTTLDRAPPWPSGSVLDHRSLPPVFESGMGISEGCFVFHFVSLPLEVAWPI